MIAQHQNLFLFPFCHYPWDLAEGWARGWRMTQLGQLAQIGQGVIQKHITQQLNLCLGNFSFSFLHVFMLPISFSHSCLPIPISLEEMEWVSSWGLTCLAARVNPPQPHLNLASLNFPHTSSFISIKLSYILLR